MARARSSSRGPGRSEGAAPRDPRLVTDAMVREAEDKLGRLEVFARSEAWLLQRTVLETRKAGLAAQRDGLLRRLGRPTADAPSVTLEQLARVLGEIDENERLLRFPEITKAMWEQQLDHMRQELIRQRAEA